MYAPEWAWKQAKEVRVYQMLAHLRSLPVPDVLYHAPSGAPGGRAVTILSRLEGRPLSEVSADLDAARIPWFYRETGAALATVHRIGQDAYGYLTDRILEPMPDNGTYMRHQFTKKLKEFQDDLHEGNVLVAERPGGWEGLYHAVELWDWFASIGATGPLGSIAGDIARLAGQES